MWGKVWMTQTTQLNNITAEQNNLVEIDRGGTLRYGIGRIYWNYDFEPLSGCLWNPEVAKIYAEVAEEFVRKVSENCVIKISADIKKKSVEKKRIFGKWDSPTYMETAEQAEIKKNLAKGRYGKCLWADYEWYAEFPYRSPITNLMTSTRWYERLIHTLKEEMELSLIKEIYESREDGGVVGVRIYPHSKIKYLEDEKETVRSYIHRDDFIVHIGWSNKWTGITIEPNPKYMNYEQLIEIIEPIFEKHGLKLINRDAPNPNLNSGFLPEEEYTYHNEYPCAGYRFFD